MLLRAEPCLPHGRIRLDPALPPRFGALQVRDVPLGGTTVRVDVRDGQLQVDGIPEGVQVVREPCPCG